MEGDQAGLLWACGCLNPIPNPQQAAGQHRGGWPPLQSPLLTQKEQHRLTPHPPHPSRAACTLQTSPRAASTPGPSIPSTRRAAPAAFPLPAPALQTARCRMRPHPTPPGVTPLPQPLQMAARRLTQADRLSTAGQLGPAHVSSFPPRFFNINIFFFIVLSFFFFLKAPLSIIPRGWRGPAELARDTPDTEFPNSPARGRAGRNRGCTEFLGRPCKRVLHSKGGAAQRGPDPPLFTPQPVGCIAPAGTKLSCRRWQSHLAPPKNEIKHKLSTN